MVISERTENELLNILKQVREMKSSSVLTKKFWNISDPLTWTHFKKNPPVEDTEETAVLDSYMEPDWKINITESDHTFSFEWITAKTVSRSDKSWVKEIGKCPQALNHERGHFDITELYTRIFNNTANSLIEQNPFPIINDPYKESELQVIRFWDFVNQPRIEYQCEYEDITAHGVRPLEQIQEFKKIQDALKSN